MQQPPFDDIALDAYIRDNNKEIYNKVQHILYNALEIGDISCADMERLMTNIKKSIVNN